MQSIGDIICKHNLKYHHYANVLQLFGHFDLHAVVHRVEQCINEIKDWIAYFLCIIDSKTEILPIIPKPVSGQIAGLRVRVRSDDDSVSECVRNIGIYPDKHLDMSAQVSRTVSTCSLHHRYLTQPTAERVVNVMITSRLDYCNSANKTDRLQPFKNAAARLITRHAYNDRTLSLLR